MCRCWSAESFLEFLNHENNTIRRHTDEEHTVKEFVFTQEVDVVIVGFCTWEEGESRIAWLRHNLHGMKLKNVLMFAQCCGSYTKEFQDKLRCTFPDYRWLFPDMYELDLGIAHATILVAQYLMKAGILGPKDSS